MSKFQVTILNSKNPFGAELVEKMNKRLIELRGGDPYQMMFEAENCDDTGHADYLNKITLDRGTSQVKELDCCCSFFKGKIMKLIGAT